jgi:outer membrane protein assembly complex protein YaeT
VIIRGNHYFSSGLIRERMQIKEVGWLASYGHFSQDLLDQDVQSILDLYHSNGFQQVQVHTKIQDDVNGVAGNMEVDVNVEEGPQTRVASLKIEGAEKVKPEELLPLLTMAEGQPYSSSNIATDRDLIMNYYFNRGFSQVSFDASATPDSANPQRMDVVYRLKEGEQIFVDRILMSGLDNTKPGVAKRQLQFESGDPLSQTAMLETQRRLYDLGVFNEVKLAVQNSEGDAEYKNILLQFTEARRWTFNYGVGMEIQSSTFGARTDPNAHTGISPTISFDVSRLNVGGRAHTLSFKSHVGRLQQQGLATYEAPRLLNHQNLRLTFNLFYDNSLNVRTFTSQRMEGSIQLEQSLSRISTLLYRFTYRRVQASELQIDPAAVPLLSRPVRVGLPSISYIRDKRDDPIETHNGNYTTLDAGVASGVFGSEANFGRLLVQNSTYHPFRGQRWVFARYTEIGIAKPFGASTGTDPTAEPGIPLPERFFAGGANGLRGFGLNQAGPRDLLTGQVLGGEAVFVNSLELRTPPLELPYVGDNLSFAFFHDAGNVFSSVGDMGRGLAQWVQKDREACTVEATSSQCNFAYLSHALGIGIRYRTPIGPVRLDVGYNLNPPTFAYYDDPVARTGFHSARTGRLQFSFSVGQTF